MSIGAPCRPKGSPIYPFESSTNAQRKQGFPKNCDEEKVVPLLEDFQPARHHFFFEKSTRKFLSRYKNHRVLLRLLWLMAPWPCHGIGRLKLLTKLRHFPDRREVSSFQHSTHLNSHTSPIHQLPSWNHSNISNVFWKSLEWRHNIEIYGRYEMNIEDWMILNWNILKWYESIRPLL